MPDSDRFQLKGYGLILLGSILFSTKAVMVKMAFRDTPIDAISLLALRMLFAFPFFLVTGFFSFRKYKSQLPEKKLWGAMIVMGLLGYYISSLLDFLGLQYITAGLERVILFLYPSFTILINAVFFKESISKKQIIALALCYTGLIVTYFHEINAGVVMKNITLGSTLIFLCAITFAGYIAGSGRLLKKVPVMMYTSVALIASSVGVFIHYAITGKFGFQDLHGEMIVYGLMLGIMATVIPNFLVSAGIKSIGANNAAIVSAVGPVSTIILAYFFLDEKMSVVQILGTALVIGGVILVSKKKKSQ